MKPFEIDRNSWHYKLAKLNDNFYHQNDLCSYIRCIIWGVIVKFFVIAASIFLICIFLTVLIFLVGLISESSAYLLYHINNNLNNIQIFFSIFFSIFITVFSLYGIIRVYTLNFDNVNFENSFIVQAYDSIKNKYCRKIVYK